MASQNKGENTEEQVEEEIIEITEADLDEADDKEISEVTGNELDEPGDEEISEIDEADPDEADDEEISDITGSELDEPGDQGISEIDNADPDEADDEEISDITGSELDEAGDEEISEIDEVDLDEADDEGISEVSEHELDELGNDEISEVDGHELDEPGDEDISEITGNEINKPRLPEGKTFSGNEWKAFKDKENRPCTEKKYKSKGSKKKFRGKRSISLAFVIGMCLFAMGSYYFSQNENGKKIISRVNIFPIPCDPTFIFESFIIPLQNKQGYTYIDLKLSFELSSFELKKEIIAKKEQLRGVIYELLSQGIYTVDDTRSLEELKVLILKKANIILTSGEVLEAIITDFSMV